MAPSSSVKLARRSSSFFFAVLLYSTAVLHSGSAIDALAHLLDLVFQTVGLFVGEADGQRLLALDGVDDGLCQFGGSLAAFQEGFVDGKAHTQVLTVLANDVYLLLQVRVVTVQGDHDGLSEALHIADVAVQVLQTLRQSRCIGLLDMLEGHTAVHLQALCGGNDDHQSGLQTGLAALDVEELLGTDSR